MDFIGVTRTIDQAVYMLLNALAIVLWRIDSAIIGMSLYSYATQDWLTGNGGGVWYIMDWLLDTSGLFGLNTWTLFASLALMLWGLSRIARPFIPSAPVHPGKLLIFFVISYVVISQGSALMQDIEQWRLDAGSTIYESVASSGSPTISVPSVPSTSDPLAAPSNLDGQNPIRGWEAVASSYFLATTTSDLHHPYPPQAFRVAYCLYNPDQPIETQTTTNAQGCSPQRAWDEWDVSSQSIFDLFGIDIGELTGAFGDFFSFFDDTIDLDNIASPIPFVEHHPENRELGIRQAQAGVARLALGIIVALFPIIEANISLMLALAASFIYLTLPVVVLFGFFLATESMTNRLLMQFVYVIVRTLIINGIVALFMLLLMNTAISGSLTAYLGLVGVGLVGGFFLARIAASTMKETLSQSMGALGAVWMGTTTGLLGKGAAQPARTAMGMAKMGAAAALLGAGGTMSAMDLAETSYEGFRSGAKDMRAGAPGTMNYLDRQTSRLPASLARMAQSGTGADEASGLANQLPDMMTTLAAPLAVGALAALSPTKTTTDESNANGRPPTTPDANGSYSSRWQANASPTQAVSAPSQTQTRNDAYLQRQRQAQVAGWLSQMYQAQQTQRGQKQALERGRDLLGEELAWKAERALGRHSQAQVNTVLDTVRQVANEHDRSTLIQKGRLTGQAITAIRDQLDEETAQAFSGQKGTWDLAALTAVALQQQTAASPEAFRQAVANAESGWGQDAPGQTVPRRLGLDPVAAGAHYTAINRFTRLSEEAGLSAAQREHLLAEAQVGQISDETRAEIEASLKKQREQGRGQGLTSEAIIAGALAMPATLSGPEQVWTTPTQAQSQPAGAEQKAGQAAAKKETGKPGPVGEAQRVRPNEKRTVLTQTGEQVYQPPNVAGQPVHLGQTLKNSLRDQPQAKPGQPVTDGKQAKSPPTETETGVMNGQNGPGKGNPKNGTTPPPSPTSQNQSPPKKKSASSKAGQTQPAAQTKVDSAATAPPPTTGVVMPIAATAASVKSGADPASVTTKTTNLGQDLNAGVKGQPADTPSNQATKPARTETRPSAPISNSSGKPEVGQPALAGVSDTPAPPTTQGQNLPSAMTPANSQPVSPRTAPPASSSTNQPVQPIPDRSSPVGSQASPLKAPETPRAPDAAAPTPGSVNDAPASLTSAPLPPKEPPTRKTDAGQQQERSRAKAASNQREPLKSPRQTGGQS
ncbi:MAG: hypothetical protein KDJ65_00290 [Anaerolineae bacterium]|nr:hypothetical protein [Anaerolineae bacterium]